MFSFFPFTATKHNGTEVLLKRTIEYQFQFSCEYDYHLFPFDVQECDIEVSLEPQGHSCALKWDEANIVVTGNSSTISTYLVAPVRYVVDPSGDKVVLKLLFTRKFDSHLFNTFLPCVLLCVLSDVSLFFDIDAFTDRITITLSLLIVLASLFAQVATSNPASPNPKLVDVFFFYCILRVSLVFLLHSAIERKKRDLRRKEEESSSDDVVVLKDLGVDIAWSRTPKSGSTSNTPSVINNFGLAVLVFLDVAAFVFFVVWAVVERARAFASFDNYSRY